MASRLASTYNVLVIEAGINDIEDPEIEIPFVAPTLTPHTLVDWNFTTVDIPGLNGRNYSYPRGFVLGGSTSVNTLAYNRGSRDDWDRYANVTGDYGWSWDSMEPYFYALEHLSPSASNESYDGKIEVAIHGTNGPLGISGDNFPLQIDPLILNASSEVGGEFAFNPDVNRGDMIGISWQQQTIAGGQRVSSARAFIDPIINGSNLDVVLNTRVLKLLQTGTVDGLPAFQGVQFATSPTAQVYNLTAAKEVILSAGTAMTPAILMHSGIGNSAELESVGIETIVNIPDLGKNVQDHPLTALTWTVNSNSTLDNVTSDANFAAYASEEWATSRTGPFTVTGGNLWGWHRVPANSSIFDNTTDPSAGETSAHYETIFFDLGIDFSGGTVPPGHYITALVNLIAPSSRGTIALATSDPWTLPLLNPNILNTTFDVQVLIEGYHNLRSFLSTPAWSDYILEPFGSGANATTDEELEQFARNTAITLSHIVGSASMSPATSNGSESGGGVVNPDLTVKGTAGLRVVDASILPFIPSGHTSGATYLVGMRAADLILNGATINATVTA